MSMKEWNVENNRRRKKKQASAIRPEKYALIFAYGIAFEIIVSAFATKVFCCIV